MMKVLMQTNLGSTDAARIGLNFSECTEGSVVEAPGDTGDWLIAQGYASKIEETQKAIPPEPVEAVKTAKSRVARKDD